MLCGISLGVGGANTPVETTAALYTITLTAPPSLAGLGSVADGENRTALLARLSDLGGATTDGPGPVTVTAYLSGGSSPVMGGESVSVMVRYEAPDAAPMIHLAGSFTVEAALTAPAFSSAPGVTGEARVNQALTAATGSVLGHPAPSLTWQWLRDGAPIPGATDPSYTVTLADEGSVLALRQGATNSEGSDTADSAPTPPVIHAAPTAAGSLGDQSVALNAMLTPVDLATDFTGADLTFSLAPGSAALPAGLSLSPAGSLTGTPTLAGGPVTLVIRAANSGGTIDSGFSITITTAPVNFATQGTVQFPYEGTPRVTGTTWDGAAYIVVPEGETITLLDPTPGGGTGRSGAMINPLHQRPGDATGFDLAFDDRASNYNAANGGTFPATLGPGDIIVKARSVATTIEDRDGLFDEWAVCHIVSAVPAPDAVSPAPFGWSGRGAPVWTSVDTALVDGLRPLLPTGSQRVWSNTSTMINTRIDRFNAGLLATSGAAGGGYETHSLFSYGSSGGSDRNYGAQIAQSYRAGILQWMSDSTDASNDRFIRHLVTLGTWLEQVFVGRSISEYGDGGHFEWITIARLFALLAQNRAGEMASLNSGPTNQMAQGFTLTQALLDRCVAHDNNTDPFTWRLRDVSAINATTITIDGNKSGDPTWFMFRDLECRKADGTLIGTVTSGSVSKANAIDFTLDAVAGLTTSDQVYFTPAYTLAVGQHHWVLESVENFNTFNPAPNATYLAINSWTVESLMVEACGLNADGTFDAMIGHTRLRAEDPGWPHPFGRYQNSVTDWAEDAWADWGATLFPPVAAPPALNAVVYAADQADVTTGDVSAVSALNSADADVVQTVSSRRPSIANNLITFDGTDEFLEPATNGVEAAVSTINVPDGASGGSAGNGFTNTGLHRLADGRWAVGNDGRATSGATQASSLVIVSGDFTTIDDEFLTSAYDATPDTSVQGVTQDDAGNIWFTSKAAQLLLAVNPDTGVETDRIALSYAPNGLGWDSLRGELIVHDEAAATLRWLTPAGVQQQTRSVASVCDQITFDRDYGTEGAVWFTSGANGSNGDVSVMDVASGTSNTYFEGLDGADAIEGIYYDRPNRRLHIASDGFFHNGSPSTNVFLRYDVPPPLPPQFALFWSGAALDSSANATAMVMGYGKANASLLSAAIYQPSGTDEARLIIRSNGVSSVASFPTSNITVDANYWLAVDMEAGSNGEATLFIDGVAHATVGLSASVGSSVVLGSDGVYAGALERGDVTGGYMRYWDGQLRAWGISFDPGNRAAVEATYP